VDNEFARRRECLKAVGDVWAALMQLGLDFTVFKDYLDSLPRSFNPNQPIDETGKPAAEVIGNRVQAFFTKWVQIVEPEIFVAQALLQDTPLDPPIREISDDFREITNHLLPEVRQALGQGRRPTTARFDALSKQLLARRTDHLDLARQHFSLTLDDVEAAAFRRRIKATSSSSQG
jgi:hypothetical protein